MDQKCNQPHCKTFKHPNSISGRSTIRILVGEGDSIFCPVQKFNRARSRASNPPWGSPKAPLSEAPMAQILQRSEVQFPEFPTSYCVVHY
ncbi:hypothetical protein TNIN_19231 [Trichonephila inaurata madagascariensis]|uniref:Uncharacterized protein n=1 Tax=Trichonephila inaurata madagascariensis TaxID=2747483 RepID=A0A8X7C688_9ARAC|nr:hypothetical protein TNIN_19231 [Trichonephila inaurata madagascariensis]